MAHKIWHSGIALNEIIVNGRVVGYIHRQEKGKRRTMAYREDGSTMGYIVRGEFDYTFEARSGHHAHEFGGQSVKLSKN